MPARISEDERARRLPGRFWKRVAVNVTNPDACWEWTGYKPNGYGRITIKRGKIMLAHRLAYELFYGPIGTDALCVCHACDNPGCVRPDHLWLGTLADNTADMVAKGRATRNTSALWLRRRRETAPKGEASARSKVTESEVRAMRALRAEGVGIREIARRYPHMSRRGIQFILRGRTWGHVA